jgi:CelD/BcsL family acetyltransferase involved in cellulose biosynthesis
VGVEVAELGGAGLTPFEQEWRALEASASASVYVGFDWLSAWLETYRPVRVNVVRISDGDTAALGLIEARGRRWRFAGTPLVTPYRGLLCAGSPVAAWTAFAGWLRDNPDHWRSLEADQVPAAAEALPRALLVPNRVPAVELPDTFGDYLASLPGEIRRRHGKRQRAFERAGGTIAVGTDLASAVRDLLRLHKERARQKGEVHPQMNDQLGRLLVAFAARGNLVLTRAEADGALMGVSAHIDYGDTTYSYNGGIVATTRLSPGIMLEVAAIRRAMDRGARRFDLGPGEYRFKTELGSVPEERFTAYAASHTLGGAAACLRYRVRSELARSEHLRRVKNRVAVRAARGG